MNSDVVIENGGATDGSDSAQKFLDGTSAGSGPFVLDTLDLSSQVVLTKSDEYNGDEEAAYGRVVVRNVSESATQLANLKGGDSMVAMDLNGDQVSGLGDGLNVESVPSGQTIFLLLNQSEAVAGDLANVKIAEAIRYALDYDALLELAGAGAVQATGVIPPGFEGALDSGVEQDLDKSKAALAEAGYTGQTLKLQFPNDYPVGGVEFTPLAERVQAQLEDAGITVELAPGPVRHRARRLRQRHRGLRPVVLGSGLRRLRELPSVRSRPEGRSARRMGGRGQPRDRRHRGGCRQPRPTRPSAATPSPRSPRRCRPRVPSCR